MNGTRVWVDGKFAGRFEVFVYGGRNTLFSWSQMAMVAPLERVQGGIDGLRLEAGTGGWNGGGVNRSGGPTFSSGAGSHSSYWVGWINMFVALVCVSYILS